MSTARTGKRLDPVHIVLFIEQMRNGVQVIYGDGNESGLDILPWIKLLAHRPICQAASVELLYHFGRSHDMPLSDRLDAEELEKLFPGDNEMSRLIRLVDWSRTEFGPVDSWPQSLRTAVSICLGSRHPIVLWWGPDRTMFYNDAYRPMLGETKHPQFFGGSGKECWAEIWDIIGPMMDQVMETGEATWSEDLFLLMFRSGYLEETYFTFSYSPIRDERGKVGGIFNACTESTARVLSDRRLKILHELAVEARTAKEAALSCAEVLGHDPRDVPFALVYLMDDEGEHLRLIGSTGLEPGTSEAPIEVEMNEPDKGGWPLSRVATGGVPELLEDLAERFDICPENPGMSLPIRRWSSPSSTPDERGQREHSC